MISKLRARPSIVSSICDGISPGALKETTAKRTVSLPAPSLKPSMETFTIGGWPADAKALHKASATRPTAPFDLHATE